MTEQGIRRTRRFTAGIMGIMVLVVVLFSSVYLAHELNHECSGEDCPVCAVISQCENTLRQMGTGAAVRAQIILSALCLYAAVCIFPCLFRHVTLVTKKIRLDN